MNLTIDNQLVGLAELRTAWQEPMKVSLGDTARRRIAESNELIVDVVAGGERVYGVNTGFGQLAQVRIDDDELAQLQENLVRSHAVGVGDDLDELWDSMGAEQRDGCSRASAGIAAYRRKVEAERDELRRVLAAIRDYPPDDRRDEDGYPAEVCHDEWAYRRVVDAYREAAETALAATEGKP